MAYILGQYNKTKNDGLDNNFMTFINDGTVERIAAKEDDGVLGFYDVEEGGSLFSDEGIRLSGSSSLDTKKSYYFHGKIKRMESPQVFDIKLIHYDISQTTEQYIKTITVAAGNIHEWVDLEFIFNPYQDFDIILFELRRIAQDYREETRFPKIIYEELSEINNLISFGISEGKKLLKIGVQSRPGLLMCINGEEIRSSRSGIYELKQGVIVVNFFSVVSSAIETTNILIESIENINEEYDEAMAKPTIPEQEAALSAISSICLWNTGVYPKTRVIDNFTLDYLYREE
jgi:hypothetical protein